ncbi:MAG: porin [Bradyrhizobium sp.]|uniref:porin n=1 Tax=Bradyrhizobium sp. TaxID=376 RepID=UPI0025C3914E|nr:porin [Bradyrhizobium sp.]MBI5264017.1 porin [Bradyrhizobium sp.]
MNVLKSALLASAGGLIVMSAAQAADLPVKAKAVEYVKICSLYGAGFYYIPGTDTCIKLGGYLRVDAVVNSNGFFNVPAWNGDGGQINRKRNYFMGRSREELNIDTRTATELGVVRTFFDATFTWDSGTDIASGKLGVYYAFIQFAGFTLGKAVSQFDVPWTNYPANFGDGLVGGSGDVTGVNQLTYTADFGQGISGTISLQDPTLYYTTNIWNTSGATLAGAGTGVYGSNGMGGTAAPDVIGQIRIDQAWGLFQASFAGHDNHTSYYTVSNETLGHPEDKWGWAAQLGVSIKNIPSGPGDTFNFSATYADGASRYVFQSLLPTAFAMYGMSPSVPGAYQTIAFAGVSDAVFAGTSTANGTGLELTKSYGVRGGFTHNWDAKWNSSIFGAWAKLEYSNNGKALVCATYVNALQAASTCDPDFEIWQIGTKTSWTPVRNLTLSGEVMYTKLDQKNTGAIALPAIGTKPASTYEFKDQGTWTAGFRAQRNW